MKKILFILLLLPAVAALGHDVYFFTQNPDKGFRLSDLGKLWDTYHKESHDQWKINIHEIEGTVQQTIKDIVPQEDTNEELVVDLQNESEDVQKNVPDFQSGFAQSDVEGQTQEIMLLPEKDVMKQEPSALQKFIGFLLQQKAVFIFGVIALLAYLLNAILCKFCSKKSEKSFERGGISKKKGPYKYGRK